MHRTGVLHSRIAAVAKESAPANGPAVKQPSQNGKNGKTGKNGTSWSLSAGTARALSQAEVYPKQHAAQRVSPNTGSIFTILVEQQQQQQQQQPGCTANKPLDSSTAILTAFCKASYSTKKSRFLIQAVRASDGANISSCIQLSPDPVLATGTAEPLGPSLAQGGINFAVAAPNASKLTLVLFDASGKELQQFPLSAEQNRCAGCAKSRVKKASGH